MASTQIVRFTYVNHRGERAERRVLPIRLWFGKTEYHPDEQWLLHAFDVEKLAPRDFAVVDIIGWQADQPEKPPLTKVQASEIPCADCGCMFAAHFHIGGACVNCKPVKTDAETRCRGYRASRW